MTYLLLMLFPKVGRAGLKSSTCRMWPKIKQEVASSECLTHPPAVMPWLASNMIPVRPTLKMALWPKLSMASVVVVFSEADS